jgi:hypothetical protein
MLSAEGVLARGLQLKFFQWFNGIPLFSGGRVEMNSRTSCAEKDLVLLPGSRMAMPTRKQISVIALVFLALSLAAIAHAQDDAVTAIHGTIQKVDSTAKVIVVKTDDGVGHTLHIVDRTAVHGGDATDVAAKDSWHGLKAGREVVVHYTERGSEETAVEFDKVGDGGLKATEGTVKEIDRGGKSLVVVAGDGTEQTFRLTGHAAKDAGAGVGKGAKVTVYYIGESGKKVAHFFGTTSSGPH